MKIRWMILGSLFLASESFSATYQLNDVVFNDGASAFGYFDWTMSEGASNISITTTGGNNRDFDVYYSGVSSGPSVIGNNFGLSLEDSSGLYFLDISVEFTGPLINTLYLTSQDSAPDIAYQYGEYGADMSYRYLQTGYISEVPVPPSILLYASGLFGFMIRKLMTSKECKLFSKLES